MAVLSRGVLVDGDLGVERSVRSSSVLGTLVSWYDRFPLLGGRSFE
jgi:hypothetical protein